MTKPKKPKRQASPGSPEKGLWDPPFLSETLVLKEKAAIYALNRLSAFLGVEDKEFGASNIWREFSKQRQRWWQRLWTCTDTLRSARR